MSSRSDVGPASDAGFDPVHSSRLGERLRRASHLTRPEEYASLAVAWVVVTAWVWARLDQGWVAHDDGAFAQSARRVLEGQLPHREFAELYTGGLTFVNAATMYLLGDDLVVLRYPLFAVFLGLVPAAYFVCRSVTGPWPALAAAVLVGTWSVPVYPAAVPSWYLLMFSVYAAACLIRWRTTGHDRWLLAAGLLAGIAVAFKIVGVYLVVAVLVFLLFAHPRVTQAVGVRRVDWASIGGLAVVGGLLASVLGSRHGSSEMVNLALPVIAVAIAAVLERVRRRAPGSSRDGTAGSLRSSVAVFLVGVSAPLAALLAPYVAAGAVGDFLEGVFVSPQSRRDAAYWSTPSAFAIVFALVLAGLVVVGARLPANRRPVYRAGVAVTVLVLLILAGDDRTAYLSFWVTGRGMGPLIVFIGVALLVRRPDLSDTRHREIAFLLLAIAAFTGLVQYPFGAPIYYCYVAPLVGLAVVAVASISKAKEWWIVGILTAAFALYGGAYLDRASINTLGYRFVADRQTALLDADRASIRVDPIEANETRRIVALLKQHSRGQYTFAGPDTPHLYVLSDLRNPTRSLFDFLDVKHSSRGEALIRTLREDGVTAIAINRRPTLSSPLDAATLRRLAILYPNLERVGRVDVRWKRG